MNVINPQARLADPSAIETDFLHAADENYYTATIPASASLIEGLRDGKGPGRKPRRRASLDVFSPAVTHLPRGDRSLSGGV